MQGGTTDYIRPSLPKGDGGFYYSTQYPIKNYVFVLINNFERIEKNA